MTTCEICGQIKGLAEVLPVCTSCLRNAPNQSEHLIQAAHSWRNYLFELPEKVPQEESGIMCRVCANKCIIPTSGRGYCGLRSNIQGHLEGKVTATKALMHYYFDPHVTNCCGAYFCPGGTGVGYPQWAKTPRPEYGFTNLSVFLYGCGLDCLFCQNVSHKQISQGTLIDLEDFLTVIERNTKVSCICYFGGSPEPQLPFILRAVETCKVRFKNRLLRQCFEMNGHGNPGMMKKIGKHSETSGGIIKFDLKAFSDPVYRALCGVSKNSSFENFEMLADMLSFDNKEYPPLMATTLLVPHYVDSYEVEQIARFLKELNQPAIEYSLLIFHPRHLMTDLPVTPLKQAQSCYDAAKRELGKRPHIGNIGLLQGRLRF